MISGFVNDGVCTLLKAALISDMIAAVSLVNAGSKEVRLVAKGGGEKLLKMIRLLGVAREKVVKMIKNDLQTRFVFNRRLN